MSRPLVEIGVVYLIILVVLTLCFVVGKVMGDVALVVDVYVVNIGGSTRVTKSLGVILFGLLVGNQNVISFHSLKTEISGFTSVGITVAVLSVVVVVVVYI